MGTRTERRRSSSRAERALATQRLRAPATIANTARNARAEIDRHARWAPARDALWQLLQRQLKDGARVAVVGAGNCDDLPLTLALAELNPQAAVRLAARGRGPHASDPRVALTQFAIPIHETALWRWPFAAHVDYLVCATVTKGKATASLTPTGVGLSDMGDDRCDLLCLASPRAIGATVRAHRAGPAGARPPSSGGVPDAESGGRGALAV